MSISLKDVYQQVIFEMFDDINEELSSCYEEESKINEVMDEIGQVCYPI